MNYLIAEAAARAELPPVHPHMLRHSCARVGEDLDVKSQVPFPRLINSTPEETVVLAWIVFKSRAHRDEVNAKVMKDPRLAAMDPNAMPFDCKRMAYGGFEVLVEDVVPVPDGLASEIERRNLRSAATIESYAAA